MPSSGSFHCPPFPKGPASQGVGPLWLQDHRRPVNAGNTKCQGHCDMERHSPYGCGTSQALRAHLRPYDFGTSPARPRPQSRILVRMDTEHGQSKLVGRFAPTPSGRMHLGNIYASLLAWLSIRSANGALLLRIEDLDERTRSGPWTSLLLDDLRCWGSIGKANPSFSTIEKNCIATRWSALLQPASPTRASAPEPSSTPRARPMRAMGPPCTRERAGISPLRKLPPEAP